MPPPVPRDQVPGYELLELLGRGGMGEVWRARRVATGTEVAIKLIRSSSPTAQARFLREGQLTASVDRHPGIVRVHECGTTARGQPFLVYALVEGARTLEQAFQGAPLRRRVEWIAAAAEALGAAHAAGVVHRDVKPENVLVDARDVVRVTDFGLATAFDLERLTQTGAIVGTPAFMAPEQVAGRRELGPGVDVWALGCVLHLALTGSPPFQAGSFLELAAKISQGSFPRPSTLDPSTPAPLEAVCLRALALQPEERHADGAALAGELRAWLDGRAVAPAPRPRRGRGARAGVLGALLLGTGAVVALGSPRPPAAQAPVAPRSHSLGELLLLMGELGEAELRQAIGDPDPARSGAARILLARATRAADPRGALELLAPVEPRYRVSEEVLPLLLIKFDAMTDKDYAHELARADPAALATLRARTCVHLAGAIETKEELAILRFLRRLCDAGPEGIPPPTLERLLRYLAGPSEQLNQPIVMRALADTGVRVRRGEALESLLSSLETSSRLDSYALDSLVRLDADVGLEDLPSGEFRQSSLLLSLLDIPPGVELGPAERDLFESLGPVQRARWIVAHGGDLEEARRLDPDGPLVILVLAERRHSDGDVRGCVAALKWLLELLDPEQRDVSAARRVGTRRTLGRDGPRQRLQGLISNLSREDFATADRLALGFVKAGALRFDDLPR